MESRIQECLGCLVLIWGPVVRRPISANLSLDFNPGFFSFYSNEAFSQIIFCFLLRSSNHHIVDTKNLTKHAF